MSEKIIYSTIVRRVPEKAHGSLVAAAQKHGITVNEAYVQAGLLLAKKRVKK